MMKVQIYITLKPGVLDTQGKAITNALHGLGYSQVEETRQGKLIEITLNTNTKDEAAALTEKMCKALLANMVIENYRFDIVE